MENRQRLTSALYGVTRLQTQLQFRSSLCYPIYMCPFTSIFHYHYYYYCYYYYYFLVWFDLIAVGWFTARSYGTGVAMATVAESPAV